MSPSVKSLTALLVLAGCYRYVPTSHAELPPSTPVTIELTTRGGLNVAPKLGDNVVGLEGNVAEASTSSLTLSLAGVRRRGDTAVSTWSGEAITLASEDIGQIKRRELSRSRTAVASAAVGAASVSLVIAIAKAAGKAEGSTGGKPSPSP